MVGNNQINKHNFMNTNQELIPLKKTISIIEKKAIELTIKTDADMSSASDFMFKVSQFQKAVEAKKDKYVAPANAIIKEARLTYNPIIKQCEEAEYSIKQKMIMFEEIKERLALKKLEKIASRVSEGKISLEQASESIDAAKPVNQYSGDEGAISFRINKVIKITDETKIPRKWLTPNMVAIRSACLAGEVIPGVEVVEEKIVAKVTR